MKIVCDSCGAKYSIADEKVAGKVFKIRCKKCTEVIVVRGDQPDAGDAGAAVAAAGGDFGGGGDAEGVWHIVVEGDQQGPMTPEQIAALMSEGRVDWEAYVWREGFDGWKAARDVPELVAAISGEGASGVAASAAAAPAAAGGGFGADMGADPFASDEGANDSPFGASGGSLFGGEPAAAKPAARQAGGDLFAAPTAGASPFGGGGGEEDDGVVASTPSPRMSSGSAPMTGQRNENSVLFSLSNLQALATGAPEKSPAPMMMGSGPSAPARSAGHATAEGSGLIDIRALAGATSAMAAAPRSSAKASVDDLLSIGSGGGLGGGLAPVLAPVAQEPERGGKNLVVILAAVAAVAIIGLGATLVVILSKKEDPTVVVNQPGLVALPAGGTPVGGTPAPGAPPGTTPSAAPAVPSAEATAPAPAAPTQDPSIPRTARPSGSRPAGATGARRPEGGAGEPASAPAAAAPSESSMRGGSSDSIDNLLNSALDRGSRPAASSSMAAAASGDLADTPSRSDVMSGLNGVSAAVRNCKQGRSGTARARVVFSGDTGRVSSVEVDGDFAGGPENGCIERAVRAARVPPFGRPSFNVTFPYRL